MQNKDYIDPITGETRLQKFLVEYPNRNRILQDSISLIQTTNDISTLNTRYSNALCESTWIIHQESKGMPIKLPSDSNRFHSNLNRAMNFHVVRIAKYKFEIYKREIHLAKTRKKIDNEITLIFDILNVCFDSLKASSINRKEAFDELTEIYNNIEDIYSNL